MKVLVVVAHPDDEVLGCGGTIACLARNGNEVNIAILGEGITSRYEHPEDAEKSSIETLHAQSREAGLHLAAKEVLLFRLPDNRFDTIPLLDIIKEVERLVERLQPEVVYTHHGGDLNIDHRIVHQAVLTATRPFGDCPVKEILTFEVPSSTDWAFHQFKPEFHPNVFVDIAETLEIKVQSMQTYESETRSFPHPRSAEALRASAHRWGSVVGLEAAEAFELIRSVR